MKLFLITVSLMLVLLTLPAAERGLKSSVVSVLENNQLSLEQKLKAIGGLVGVPSNPESENKSVYTVPKRKTAAKVDGPPILRLNVKGERLQTPYESFMLEVLAASPSGSVKEVLISGMPALFESAPCVAFTHELRLVKGKNSIVIAVRDERDRITSRTIEFERVDLAVGSREHRAVLAVLPLGDDKNGSTDILAQFVLETERFRLAERKNLAAILAEQKLSGSLFANKKASIKLGKILSARYSLAGEIRMDGDLEIVTRLIDNETSEVVALIDAYSPNTSRDGIRYCMRHLAGRLRQSLPLFESKVIKVDGNRVLLSKPAGINSVEGMDFVLIHKDPDMVDDATGEVILPGSQVVVAKARLHRSTRQGLLCTVEGSATGIKAGQVGVTK